MMTKAVIYSRFSTDRQDARSIDDQVRRCRVVATQRGLQVVNEYADAATSGTHTQRNQLQQLLAAADRREFDSVLVDDLSRLSRDLGDVWNLVFNRFALAGVTVVDGTTGIGSDSASARMVFGTMGLVSDVFIQMIRHETHRGLEGRALAGFATGGKTYGYSTVQEPNPPDPEHPRKLRVIDRSEAAVVLRVFEMFARGTALKVIAATLNTEGIPAPHDGGKGNKRGRGWGHTTIRSMVRNATYTGIWVWNKFKWLQVPGKNTYKPVARPASEHVRKEIPELRIVPVDLWERARARFRQTKGGRPQGVAQRSRALLSGLLRCGICGSSFGLVSRTVKNGVSYGNLGCVGHTSRGAASCSNNRTISERKVTEAVIGSLRDQLTKPELIDRFVAAFERSAVELERDGSVDTTPLEREVQQSEQRMRNMTEAIAKAGMSEALLQQLQFEEERLRAAKLRLQSALRQRPKIVRHPRQVEGYLRNLLASLEADQAKARELLVRYMPPLLMTPEGRAYKITGGFDLCQLLADTPGGGAPGGGGLGTGSQGNGPHGSSTEVCEKISRRDRD